jgi:ATP-dependent RNA circularization protein (DNA/RNA ligase family)
VKDDFYKFPSTPHLALLGEIVVRHDKVMSQSQRDEFLTHDLVIEEKVDGANLGISFDSSGNIIAQNRGAYLDYPYSGQWKKLSEWLTPKTDELLEMLTDRYILFGEWCYARHSVQYDLMPDWFFGFDVFDKKDEIFLSCRLRDELFREHGVTSVPLLKRGRFSFDEITGMLSKSRIGNQPAEGLYMRYDAGDRLIERAKLVRPEFIQAVVEHWSRKRITPNRIARMEISTPASPPS